MINSDLEEGEENRNISYNINGGSPIRTSEHLLPKIKTKRKPMGALHQSMNATVGSRARAPFRSPEGNEGELSAPWRAYSPTRSNNASYKPTIMSLVNARNSLPNPMEMEEYAWNKLRLKVE